MRNGPSKERPLNGFNRTSPAPGSLMGSGFISDFHYNGFSKIENVEITGCASNFAGDENEIKRQKGIFRNKCEQWNITQYNNFDEMVADPNVDALVIMSINPEHFSQIMKAVENGKHVIAEKPVVADLSQLDEIEKAAEEKGVIIFPAHNFIYKGAVQEAKKIIESGKLGRIFYSSFIGTQLLSEAHSLGWRSRKSLSYGGALMDSGHHLVYMSLYLMGMPKEIHSFKSKLLFKDMECEDIAQVNLLYPDNSIGCIMQSWVSNYGAGINGVKIFGDKGQILITDALYYNSEKINSDTAYDNSFYNQAKAFVDCIIKGKKPVSTLDDARNALRLIYGAYESSDNNKVIEL